MSFWEWFWTVSVLASIIVIVIFYAGGKK